MSAPSLTLSLPTLPLSLCAPHPPHLPLCWPHMPGHVEERSSPPHSQRAEGFPGERADQILHLRWPNHCEGEPLCCPHSTMTLLSSHLPNPFFLSCFPSTSSSAGLAASRSGMMDGPSAPQAARFAAGRDGALLARPLLPSLLAVSLPSSQAGSPALPLPGASSLSTAGGYPGAGSACWSPPAARSLHHPVHPLRLILARPQLPGTSGLSVRSQLPSGSSQCLAPKPVRGVCRT